MTSHSTQPAQPSVDYSRKWGVMISVAMGVFLSTIDGSIVNVSLPTLEKAFETNFATVQWVVVSYLLVVTALMLGVARLADMIGKKRIYLTGMVIFTMGSLLCGIAPTIGMLIGFRALQGIGAVCMQALGVAIVTEAFPSSQRGRALGIIGTIVSLGISLGPTLGGVLIGAVGWRAIFLVNLPVGALGLVLGRRFIPDWRPPGGQRFDWAGAALLFVTLVALALGLTFGPDTGWDSPRILALLFGSGLGMLIFLTVERRLSQPMIDLTLFRDALFSVSLLTGLMVFIVVAGLFVLPFYLELVKGYAPERVGLYLTVVPAALGLTAPVAGAISDRYGSRGITLAGLIVLTAGCVSVSTLDADTTTLGYIVRLLPIGLGAGMFQSPNNSAIMGAAPPTQLGVASGLLALSRTFGQVVGIPLVGAIFASRVLHVAELPPGVDTTDAPPWALVAGVETTFLTLAGLIAVGVLLAAYAFRTDRVRHRQVAPRTPTT